MLRPSAPPNIACRAGSDAGSFKFPKKTFEESYFKKTE